MIDWGTSCLSLMDYYLGEMFYCTPKLCVKAASLNWWPSSTFSCFLFSIWWSVTLVEHPNPTQFQKNYSLSAYSTNGPAEFWTQTYSWRVGEGTSSLTGHRKANYNTGEISTKSGGNENEPDLQTLVTISIKDKMQNFKLVDVLLCVILVD